MLRTLYWSVDVYSPRGLLSLRGLIHIRGGPTAGTVEHRPNPLRYRDRPNRTPPQQNPAQQNPAPQSPPTEPPQQDLPAHHPQKRPRDHPQSRLTGSLGSRRSQERGCLTGPYTGLTMLAETATSCAVLQDCTRAGGAVDD